MRPDEGGRRGDSDGGGRFPDAWPALGFPGFHPSPPFAPAGGMSGGFSHGDPPASLATTRGKVVSGFCIGRCGGCAFHFDIYEIYAILRIVGQQKIYEYEGFQLLKFGKFAIVFSEIS